MVSQKHLFLQHLAQTSTSPLLLEVEKAEGTYIYDTKGKKYLDLISGIAVSNLGHRHPNVVEAIKNQTDKYLHTMVYGEHIQSPQVAFARLLTKQLPNQLDSVFLVNSGSEAIEGAIKLAKRYTARFEVVAFNNAYHGSTHGALSIMGNEILKNPFRPLLPGVKFIGFNNEQNLDLITYNTACVVVEPIQGEAGVVMPKDNFHEKLSAKCKQTGSLLIFDEVQTGFGRTGNLFAFQKYGVVPDIITIAKGMGGGMPIGAFVSSKEIMDSLAQNPILGHITTFGGHPVSAAAAHASLKTILDDRLMESIESKNSLFRKLLNHDKIKEVRGEGLMLAAKLENPVQVQKVLQNALENGLISDWFLFCDDAIRIAPPLTISFQEIEEACDILIKAIE